MRSFLRRAGLYLGLLKVPDTVKAGPKSAAGEFNAKTFWISVATRSVLLILIVIFMIETASPIWRLISVVAFCGLALGLGQLARQLTDRRR